jgi:hypothetical protein
MASIQGPVDGHGHAGVKDLESYRTVHAHSMSKANKDVFEVDEPRDAYINHSRWVVDCDCNGAGLTSLQWKVSCCFDCGRVFTNVMFPKDAKAIETELLKRREDTTRNWKNETLKVLKAETKGTV